MRLSFINAKIYYNKYLLLLFILLVIPVGQASAQDIQGIDRKMAGIPAEKTVSTTLLSGWISENFATSQERVSAAYVWLARNISYDAPQMNNTTYYKSREESVSKTLATRKGVCQGYAEVFTELCQQMNIAAWTIGGYTRQFGQVVPLPHSWNAALIDDLVYLYDPTWGAGYVMQGVYTANFNLNYFKRTPEQMLPSHMPFDPLWQFSNHPISPKDFDAGKFESDPATPYFDFRDTLAQYISLEPIEQSIARLRRIEQKGITNDLVKAEASFLKAEINIYQQNQVINQMNAAVLNFNEGVSLFNIFINYKNKQFKPAKPDKELKQMIDTSLNSLTRAAELVHGLVGEDKSINDNIRNLEKSIGVTQKKAREEAAFVDKYIMASPEMRKKMFYH